MYRAALCSVAARLLSAIAWQHEGAVLEEVAMVLMSRVRSAPRRIPLKRRREAERRNGGSRLKHPCRGGKQLKLLPSLVFCDERQTISKAVSRAVLFGEAFFVSLAACLLSAQTSKRENDENGAARWGFLLRALALENIVIETDRSGRAGGDIVTRRRRHYCDAGATISLRR